MSKINIHQTAVVHPEAKLGRGVSIGPYSIIDGGVTIGDGVSIASHCVITGQTTIGSNCKIFTGAVVGSPPQDSKYSPQDNVSLHLGENNIIREYVTINPGTVEGGGKTIIGGNNLLMAYVHIAHDCIIGNHCVLANNASLAGHVTLEDNAIIGGLAAIHQFCRLGRLSILGGCSRVVQDVPPFSMCVGYPARVIRTNLVGLRRANVLEDTILQLKRAFKILFFSGLAKSHALARAQQEIPSSPEIDHLIFFAKTSQRGLCS